MADGDQGFLPGVLPKSAQEIETAAVAVKKHRNGVRAAQLQLKEAKLQCEEQGTALLGLMTTHGVETFTYQGSTFSVDTKKKLKVEDGG